MAVVSTCGKFGERGRVCHEYDGNRESGAWVAGSTPDRAFGGPGRSGGRSDGISPDRIPVIGIAEAVTTTTRTTAASHRRSITGLRYHASTHWV